MGYIGLLLNAPYKIDRMVWMSLMWFTLLILQVIHMNIIWLYEPEVKIRHIGQKFG
jgi:hypothetical protein